LAKKNGIAEEDKVTEIANLDEKRFQLVTNDDVILKLMDKLGLEPSGTMSRFKKSKLTGKPTDEYERFVLYLIIGPEIVEKVKEKSNERNIILKITEERKVKTPKKKEKEIKNAK